MTDFRNEVRLLAKALMIDRQSDSGLENLKAYRYPTLLANSRRRSLGGRVMQYNSMQIWPNLSSSKLLRAEKVRFIWEPALHWAGKG
jgi:hypothetical protein